MQKITIANIEVKEGDNARGHWKSFIITGEDKTKVSTFDNSASVLKEGDIIEAEIEVKGKYTNLKSFNVIEHGIPSSNLQPLQTGGDRGASIESQVAAKIIAELRIANALTDKTPEYQAMLAWCRERLGSPARVQEERRAGVKSGSKSEPSVKTAPDELSGKTKPAIQEVSDNLPTDAKATAGEPVEKEAAGKVDMVWLKETLKKIHWSDSTAKSWVRSQFNLYRGLPTEKVVAVSLEKMLADCTPEQRKLFVDHITNLAELL